MTFTDKTKVNVSIAAAIVAVGGMISGGWGAGKAWSGKADRTEVELKADKKDLANLSLTVSTLADKVAELSASRREDSMTLKYIREMADRTDARMVTFENNQTWQIQQEAKRLQWQNFKQEPPVLPPANVKQ